MAKEVDLAKRERNFRYEKYLWWATQLVVAVVFFFLPAVWQAVSIYFLVVLSIHALTSTAAGNQEATHAARLAKEQSEQQ